MTAPARQRARPHLRSQRERGSASIQMVVLLPALFLLMFLGMQAALFYQGRTIILAAAQEGARDAAAENGALTAGINTAASYVSTSTNAGLKGVRVTGARSAGHASITVTAYTLSVIPGWKPQITQSANYPIERVTG